MTTARTLEVYEAHALDALTQCAGPITFQQLLEIADPRDKQKLDPHMMAKTIDALVEESFIKRHGGTALDWKYSITALGRARFSGCSPFSELHASAKAAAGAGTMVDEMRGGLRIHELSPEQCAEVLKKNAPLVVDFSNAPEPSSTAAICVDEDELDDWWETLDCEQKADAFTGFSLRMYAGESHVHVCSSGRIPVAGTIGEAKAATIEDHTYNVDPEAVAMHIDAKNRAMRAAAAACRGGADA